MNKKELLARVGDVSQIGGVRDFTFNDGKMKGVRALEINTGKISFTVLPDRCMDIAYCEYKGLPMSFDANCGIVSPAYYDEKDFSRFKTDNRFLFELLSNSEDEIKTEEIIKKYLDDYSLEEEVAQAIFGMLDIKENIEKYKTIFSKEEVEKKLGK